MVRRRLLLAFGAGLAGLFVVLLGLAAIHRGGGASDVAGVTPRLAPGVVAPATTTTTTITTVPTPVALGHDPFNQVVVPGTGPGSAPAPASPPSTTGPGPGPEPAPAPAPAPAPSSSGYATLQLTAIARDGAGVLRAHITVDGRPYTPAQGEVFSYGYRLDQIDGDCVQVSGGGQVAHMCLPAGSGG